MNRRELLVGTASLAAIGTVGRTAEATQSISSLSSKSVAVSGNPDIYVSPIGQDTNSGTKDSPLQSLVEAAKRVNAMEGSGPVTVFMAEGVYAIGAKANFTPKLRKLTKTERLTIRAEVLPDNPAWHSGRMPTLIFTMPLTSQWNGVPIENVKASNGILDGVSHVTIQDLKILGTPVVETPVKGEVNRIYPVMRKNGALDDLEISQCIFGGDRVNAPNHCPILVIREFNEHIGVKSAYYCGWYMGVSILYGYIDLFGTEGIEKLVLIDEPPSILSRPDMTPGERLKSRAIADSMQQVGEVMSTLTGVS